jgi:hypothetical protein
MWISVKISIFLSFFVGEGWKITMLPYSMYKRLKNNKGLHYYLYQNTGASQTEFSVGWRGLVIVIYQWNFLSALRIYKILCKPCADCGKLQEQMTHLQGFNRKQITSEVYSLRSECICCQFYSMLFMSWERSCWNHKLLLMTFQKCNCLAFIRSIMSWVFCNFTIYNVVSRVED